MKNFILFFACVCIYACTPKLYLGQNRDGYLVFNDAVYRGSKENIDSFLLGVKNNNFIPSFKLPGDIVIIRESQVYNYKTTEGFVIYKRNKSNFQWAKVTFIPVNQTLEGVDCDKEYVFVTVRKNSSQLPETLRFQWKAETPRSSEKWVKV